MRAQARRIYFIRHIRCLAALTTLAFAELLVETEAPVDPGRRVFMLHCAPRPPHPFDLP